MQFICSRMVILPCTLLQLWEGENWQRFYSSRVVIKRLKTNKMRLPWISPDGRTLWTSLQFFRILLPSCPRRTRRTRQTLPGTDPCPSGRGRATRRGRKHRLPAKKMITSVVQSGRRSGWVVTFKMIRQASNLQSKNKWKLKDLLVLFSFQFFCCLCLIFWATAAKIITSFLHKFWFKSIFSFSVSPQQREEGRGPGGSKWQCLEQSVRVS